MVNNPNTIEMDINKAGYRFYTNNDFSYVVDTDNKVYRLLDENHVIPLPNRSFGDRFEDNWATKEEALAMAN